MKTQIIEMIDRKIEEREKILSLPDTFGNAMIASKASVSILQELKQEILDTPEFIPEIDNFYEFSEGGEIWFEGRLMRYAYRNKNGGILSARYIRPFPNPPDIQS